jgi:N-acetylneuraminic acid mutarotase
MLSFTACPDESGKSRFTGKKLAHWKYCLTIVSLVLISIQIQAQNGWTPVTTLPTIRVAAAVEVINGKIYIVGGNGGAYFPNLAVNEAYDPSTDTWDTTLAPMPTPRGFLASGVVRDTIYAIGGGYSTLLSKVEAYDPVTDNWSTKADLLNPRFCMRAAVVDGIIYIFGGNYNQHNCQSYNPITDEWTEKTSIPIGGGGNLSVTAYNGLIYLFGGSTYPPWVALSTVYAYNPQTDTWDTTLTHMPTPRFGLQTFLFNEKIYAIGGSQAQGTSLATVEVYDPVTDTWDITLPDMPFNSLDPGQAIVDNKIYIISGTPDWQSSDGWVWQFTPPISDVEHEFTSLTEFALEQNYPNPFNPSTKIKYSVTQSSNVTIKVFDVLGNEIETLVNEEKPTGTYEVTFDSHSGEVRNLPSGIYFYQLKAGDYVNTKKMILIK